MPNNSCQSRIDATGALRQRSPTKKPTPSEEFETHESEYRQSKSVLSWSEIQDIERSNHAGEGNA
jgi:hypothetical protein